MLGIFDSGIGGLTVVRALLKAHPDLSFVYLGDSARSPYGQKSSETVRRYAREDVRFLFQHGASAIVVACNTVSAVAADDLRREYPDVPIVDVISPAVRVALAATHSGRIGVMGTRATIGSRAYERRLREGRSNVVVTSLAAPLLVPLIEEGWENRPETTRILRRYLEPFRRAQIDAFILGCTHYPMLKTAIQAKLGRRVAVIDSAEAVVPDVSSIPLERGGASPQRSLYFTDVSPTVERAVRSWLGYPERVQLAKFEE